MNREAVGTSRRTRSEPVPDDEPNTDSSETDETRGALRPVWSGTLSFGLVSIPVELYPATRRNAVALRMLDQDGTPLARRFFCPAHDQEVPPEQLVRGFQRPEGDYVMV